MIPVLRHLPRLCAVLSDVLGIEPADVHSQLDLAEALAADDLDRFEVVTTMAKVFGIEVTIAEADASESVADLLRLVATKYAGPSHTYA